MPKKETPGVVDDEPVVEIDETEPKPKEGEGSVEVDVTESDTVTPSAEEQLAAKIKADFEKLYGGKLDQVENRLRGAQRINTQLQQKLSALEQRLPPKPESAPQSARDAELQALVDKGDWQTAVAKVAQEQAEKLYQERTLLAHRQATLAAQEQTLETSKQTVIQRYPDLDPETGDANSEVSHLYTQMLNADPMLLSNPYGPEMAMYRMEQQLAGAQNGQQTAETQRQQRVAQTGLAPSRPVPQPGKVILDRDQKEFIDYHGLDPKVYAKIQQSLGQSGSVEAP